MTRYYELRLPEIKEQRPPRRTAGIEWTPGMLATLKDKFPVTFNKVLAEELGVSLRTLVRKARELGVEKEEGFLEKRRSEIIDMARRALPDNRHKGKKGFVIPGSEKYRFKKGNIPASKTDPEVAERIRRTRNETIRQEKIRLKLGLEPKTRLKLVNY